MTKTTIILSAVALLSVLSTAVAAVMLRDAHRVEHLKAECAVIYPVSDIKSMCIKHDGKTEEIFGKIVWTPAQR